MILWLVFCLISYTFAAGIQFDIQCDAIKYGLSDCQNLVSTIQSVSTRFERELFFTQPVELMFVYGEYNYSLSHAKLNWVSLNDISYPQALAKQISPRISGSTDATIHVNARERNQLYMIGDENEFESSQFDLELILVHELLHVFGFASRIMPHKSFIGRQLETVFGDDASLVRDLAVYKWSEPSILDTLMRVRPSVSLCKLVPKHRPAALRYHDLIDRLSRSSKIKSARALHYAMTKSPKIVFIPYGHGNDDYLWLYTNVSLPRSFLSHVEPSQNLQDAFLLLPSSELWAGKRLNDVLIDHNHHPSILGPILSNIFNKLGWIVSPLARL